MNIFPSPRKPRILVAPLDWGLGHTTRCIPLIHKLLESGVDVWLAGENRVAHLLKTEFPELPLLFLPGYRIVYGKTRERTVMGLLGQVPKLIRAIKQEHGW